MWPSFLSSLAYLITTISVCEFALLMTKVAYANAAYDDGIFSGSGFLDHFIMVLLLLLFEIPLDRPDQLAVE
jgi:hypothetical protein